jgi:hypothetical protein
VRRETCGRPICPDDEIRLVDDDGYPVAPGEVGELCARGPYTLRGYFRAPEHNARAFTPDGFYRSGDLMWQHPSGNYVVAGRKKDLINRGGEKISAEEVENLILAHPDVVNVACVPVPDEVLGERMCACVVLRPGAALDLAALTGFLLGFEIAKHKLPERLEILDSLPLSPVGKVSKKDLMRILTATLPPVPFSRHRDGAPRLAHRAGRAIPDHDLDAEPARPHGGVGLGEFPRSRERAGPVERQPAQRRVGLLVYRAVGHHVPRRAQAGVVPDVFFLDALQDVVGIVRGIGRPAQQHQLVRFKLHTSFSQPARVWLPLLEASGYPARWRILRRATAIRVLVGFCAPEVTKTDPSATWTLSRPCTRPYASVTDE